MVSYHQSQEVAILYIVCNAEFHMGLILFALSQSSSHSLYEFCSIKQSEI